MPSKRGLATLDRSTVQRIARLGGLTAWALGKAHAWTSEEAKDAGRKGGIASAEKRKARRRSVA